MTADHCSVKVNAVRGGIEDKKSAAAYKECHEHTIVQQAAKDRWRVSELAVVLSS